MPAQRDADRLRLRLNSAVDPTTRAVANSWLRAYTVIRDDLETAVRDAAANGPLSAADFRRGRLGRSMGEASIVLQALARDTPLEILSGLPKAVSASDDAMRAYLLAAGPHGITFNRAAPEVLDHIVRRTADQVHARARPLSLLAEQSLKRNLVRAVAAGEGPDDAARRMVREVRGIFGGGMSRAMTLARTELVDAQRAASAATREANGGYITGWQWSSSLDTRACAACWALHGSKHDADEMLEGHQNCRCVPVPVLIWDNEDDLLPTGEDLFERLTPEQQRRILGPKGYEAYDKGVPLEAFVERRGNPGWRPGHYVTPQVRWGAPANLDSPPTRYEGWTADAPFTPKRLPTPKPKPAVNPNLDANGLDMTSPTYFLDRLPRLKYREGASAEAMARHAMDHTNPRYHQDKKFRVNCLHVVQAHELRRRGYRVQATGKKYDRNTGDMIQDWRTPAGHVPVEVMFDGSPGLIANLLDAEMKPGERGWLTVHWKDAYGDGGHIMNVEKMPNGVLVIWESQKPKKAGVLDELQKAKPYAWYVRSDNLTPTQQAEWQWEVADE